MNRELFAYLEKPTGFVRSPAFFWQEPHVGEQVLKAHLDPDRDSATRNHKFVERSVRWMGEVVSPVRYPRFLDLGCGPGIYAEKLCAAGYAVTGVDFSGVSINYAKESATRRGLDIRYICRDYLTIDWEEGFDVAAIIYCDYGTLLPGERKTLLRNVRRALQPGGKLVLDVFTPRQHEGREETKIWQSCPGGGFWSGESYLLLSAYHRYDESSAVMDHYVVVERENIRYYYIWEQMFTEEMLRQELFEEGFGDVELYADIAGEPYKPGSKVLCAVATRR